MALAHDALLALFKEAFPEGEVTLTDLVGDGDHYQVDIKDTQFNGLSKIQQHRLVHASLNGKLGGELHALSIKTHPVVDSL